MYKRVWIVFFLAALAAFWLYGCAAPQQEQELTPEQVKARQDSIAKANEYELKKNRMFAYDKLKNRQWEEARKYFWKVVELDIKDEYNDWDRIYQTYMETGDNDSARIVLQMGLEHHPDDPFLNATHGFYLKAQGKYEEALEHYRKAVRAKPDELSYVKKEAELYENLNRPDEAIEAYQRVLELDPNDRESKDRYLSLIRKHRDPEEYIRNLEEEVKANPEDEDKHFELILAYEEQGMNKKVVSQVDKLLEITPGNIDALRKKAHSYENLNKLNQAIKTYEQILEIDPNSVVSMLRIADNYRLLSRYGSARSWVIKARNVGGNPPEADYILAQTYESSGDKCSRGRGLEYQDKLVYVVAYGLFQQAASGDDYTIKDKSERRLSYLRQFIPQYSDWFMNKTKKRPQADCYNWINPNWPEVSYIDAYLDQLEKSK